MLCPVILIFLQWVQFKSSHRDLAFQTSPCGGSGAPKQGDKSAGRSRRHNVRGSDSTWRRGITRAKFRRPSKSHHVLAIFSLHATWAPHSMRLGSSWVVSGLVGTRIAHDGIMITGRIIWSWHIDFFGRVARICM